jgi:hypothetical protein
VLRPAHISDEFAAPASARYQVIDQRKLQEFLRAGKSRARTGRTTQRLVAAVLLRRRTIADVRIKEIGCVGLQQCGCNASGSRKTSRDVPSENASTMGFDTAGVSRNAPSNNVSFT